MNAEKKHTSMTQKVAGGTELLNTLDLLKHAGVGNAMTVADLGCGNAGFFVMQAAKMVGNDGLVYAVDIMKPVLASVTSAAKQAGLHNVQTVWTNLEVYRGAKIPDETVDVALLINILFQSSKVQNIIREASRLLKVGGRLLVVDWKSTPSPLGPPHEMRVAPETIRKAAAELGLHEADAFDAGQYHFGLLFQKG